MAAVPAIPAAPAAAGARITTAERAAAERLGRMFCHIATHKALPLGPWAIPTDPRRTTHATLLAALIPIHGSDDERFRRLGRARYVALGELYRRDYVAIMPKLEAA